MAKPEARVLAQLFGVFHNVSYYAKELRVFQDRGIKDFWHGYMAFRSAPMGRVEAPVITATFYNFSPDFVSAAIPAAWDVVTPAEATELRGEAMATSLTNAFRNTDLDDVVLNRDAVAIADTVFAAMTEMPEAGRALFGSYRSLTPPEAPLHRLWHAATLWREYRGDGHNIVLAAEGIDGIECHVLLAGKGVANQKVIEQIRGWDASSWNAAQERLMSRGLVEETGKLTDSGVTLRRHIEDATDQLASGPKDVIGPDGTKALISQLEPIVATLVASGVVPDKWPPPKAMLKDK